MAETTTPQGTPPSETPPATTTTLPLVEGITPGIITIEKPPPVVEPAKAPEKYELKLSENSPLTQDALTRIESLAKEKGLTNDQAQLLVQAEENSLTSYKKKQDDDFTVVKNQWAEAVKNDKEIGGENLKQSIEFSKRVIERFAAEEFKKTLDVTGLGQHPEVVRLLARVGKAMSNDQLILPGAQGEGKKEMKDIFYGSQSTGN